MSDGGGGLFRRFPALRDLATHGGGKRIPYVQQLTEIECGAACLTMVLNYHGKHVMLDQVRDVLGPGRDGLTALGIINAAESFGLRGRGFRVDLEELEYLDPGTILHWRFSHFVVFEKLRKDSVDIVDPAGGRRTVPMQEFSRHFTGVALDFEPGDDFKTEKRRKAGIWPYARSLLFGHKGVLGQIIVVSLLVQLFALAVPLLTSLIVDRVLPRGDQHLLLVVSVGLGGLVLFQFLAGFVRAHLFLTLRTQLDARMTLGFLDHLMSLPYAFFQTRSSGDLMMRMNSTGQVREVLTGGALSAALDGVLVIFYLLILILASPSMGALVAGLGVLYGLVFVAARRQKRELMSQSISKDARSQGYQVEMLSGMETLKSLGAEQRAAEHWSQLFVDVLNASILRGKLDAMVDTVMNTLRFASPLVVLAWGGVQVLDGKLTLGGMLALSALASGFLNPLSSLIGTAMSFQMLASYTERIDDVLQAAPEQDLDHRRPAPKLKGAISLHKVSFRYSALAPEVVKDVTVEIPAGCFVGVVGRSGAGKSTLTALLAGLYQPTSGRISYDTYNLADFDLRSVRRQLGIVTQNPYLFGSTIRANISLAKPNSTADEVISAAKRARVHDDIQAMPMGYDTPLTDRGASLSGGQRQRLALARSLLCEPAILILDEATSALDGITERGVQAELEALKCTRVVIAHRLSTVREADLILVMHDGQLAEQGNHDQLLARGGHYARLVGAQNAYRVASESELADDSEPTRF
jgi:ABC-type bacteriocin/lantibiotic exporter with double-glycine peptidase domain